MTKLVSEKWKVLSIFGLQLYEFFIYNRELENWKKEVPDWGFLSSYREARFHGRSNHWHYVIGNLRIENWRQEILLNTDDNGGLYENIYFAILRMTERKCAGLVGALTQNPICLYLIGWNCIRRSRQFISKY